jgi:predicted ATP-binding protein involved in virulence
VLKEAKKGEQEIECVRNAVVSALGPNGCDIIADMEVRTNDNEVFFMYCDGREVRSDLLSDGYRRLVSIVVDIAFRSALLNKVMYGNEAYKYTHGTVIIDEIDEHLHPELQVRILKALHETFPKIQFIVSTHAPLVMSSVENAPENVVYKLEYNDGVYSHKELNTYGLDASTIMQVYMDLPPRDLAIDDEIKNIESLIDAEKYSDARTALEKMQERPGSDANPELSKIEATLSFFEE